MAGIVKSILDTDLYKFTTSFAYQKLFPNALGWFEYKDRNNTVWTEEDHILEKLSEEIRCLSELKLQEYEKQWAISHIPYVPIYYWEWLGTFRFNPGDVKYYLNNGHLEIYVEDIELYKATLWEIAILCIMTKLLSDKQNKGPINMEEVIDRLAPKIQLSNELGISFSEFGTRRRASFEVQDAVVGYIKSHSKYCTGTSNVYLAMKYDMRPIGTYPHEWPMFHGAMYGYRQANHLAMENWVNCYDGYLGIALSDTYTTDVFLHNFSKKLACLFDGVRQDSGDEIEFVNKVICRYEKLGIDPKTKTIIFSNALDFQKAAKIKEYCEGKIKCSFGIGTNLTNDTGVIEPSNVVMKLSMCRMKGSDYRWRYCVKLSDDQGKTTGNEQEVAICKQTLENSFVNLYNY